MDGQHDVANQPRDDHGRWTSGGGLRPGQSAEVRAAAVMQLQDILTRRDLADALGQTMEEVARTKQANITEMARVLQNEAGSDTDKAIMEAVGHTVLNRMQRNGTATVSDVSERYAHGHTVAAPKTQDLAIRLLNGQLADNTGGATHFYQPYAMAHPTPVAKDGKGNYLTGAAPEGYEYVPGVVIRGADKREPPAFSVRPVWADRMQQLKVNGIPDSLAKFFIAPGSRHVR